MSGYSKQRLDEFRGGWYELEVQTGGTVQRMRGVLRDIKPRLFGRAISLRVWSLFTLDGPGRWEDNGALVYMRPVLLPAPNLVMPDTLSDMALGFRNKRGTNAAYTLDLYKPSQLPPWS